MDLAPIYYFTQCYFSFAPACRRKPEFERSFSDAAPYAHGGVYTNFMPQDETDRIAQAYGPNYQRLQDIKAKYDPTNLFRQNQNIKPSVQGA